MTPILPRWISHFLQIGVFPPFFLFIFGSFPLLCQNTPNGLEGVFITEKIDFLPSGVFELGGLNHHLLFSGEGKFHTQNLLDQLHARIAFWGRKILTEKQLNNQVVLVRNSSVKVPVSVGSWHFLKGEGINAVQWFTPIFSLQCWLQKMDPQLWDYTRHLQKCASWLSSPKWTQNPEKIRDFTLEFLRREKTAFGKFYIDFIQELNNFPLPSHFPIHKNSPAFCKSLAQIYRSIQICLERIRLQGRTLQNLEGKSLEEIGGKLRNFTLLLRFQEKKISLLLNQIPQKGEIEGEGVTDFLKWTPSDWKVRLKALEGYRIMVESTHENLAQWWHHFEGSLKNWAMVFPDLLAHFERGSNLGHLTFGD